MKAFIQTTNAPQFADLKARVFSNTTKPLPASLRKGYQEATKS